jgi:hypothetical protein
MNGMRPWTVPDIESLVTQLAEDAADCGDTDCGDHDLPIGDAVALVREIKRLRAIEKAVVNLDRRGWLDLISQVGIDGERLVDTLRAALS